MSTDAERTSFSLKPTVDRPAPERLRARHPAVLVLWASLWIASVGNVVLWRHLGALPELHSARGFVLGVAFLLVIAGGCTAVLALLNWRGVLKPAVAFLFVATAIGAHFMLSFGVVLDPTMMTNVVQTTPSEAGSLLGWRFVALVVGMGMLPAWWVWRLRVRALPAGRRAVENLALLFGALLVMASCVLLMFQDFASLMRNHPALRYEANPFNSIFSLIVAEVELHQAEDRPLVPVGRDAQLGSAYASQTRPPLLLLVLGETARAGNFAVNGYARATTPTLSALDADGDLVSERNAWSCGTNTAASLPCMFSHSGRAAYEDRSEHYENLLDVLQHAGLAVLWIDNQSGCKGVCDRVAHVSTQERNDSASCAGGSVSTRSCSSASMRRLPSCPLAELCAGVVVVLHQMGSHGPAYFQRSPAADKRFLPECEQLALQACDRQALVNAYDNSIVYTDHFLGAAIDWLQQAATRFDGALLYVSDHGESLGENRLYLHGLPYTVAPDVQKHVPWIGWLSAGLDRAAASISTACGNELARAFRTITTSIRCWA